jgi:hypothetical protein
MKAIYWILRLYPRAWRERYEQEMLGVLEQHTVSITTLLDLLMGALDARLDPYYRSENMLFMFREKRSIVITFLTALAVMWSVMLWWYPFAFSPLAPQGGAPDWLFTTGSPLFELPIVFALMVCSPLAALMVWKEARRERPVATRWAMLFCAFVFLVPAGLTFFELKPYLPSTVYQIVLDLLLYLPFSCLLFTFIMTGIKALSRKMKGSFFFAMFCFVLALSFLVRTAAWGTFNRGEGPIMVWFSIILAMGPLTFLSAFMLYLTTSNPGRKAFGVALGVGTLLLVPMVLFYGMSINWTISHAIKGLAVVSIFNWLLPLLSLTIVGVIALLLAGVALVRGFQMTLSPQDPAHGEEQTLRQSF